MEGERVSFTLSRKVRQGAIFTFRKLGGRLFHLFGKTALAKKGLGLYINKITKKT